MNITAGIEKSKTGAEGIFSRSNGPALLIFAIFLVAATATTFSVINAQGADSIASINN